MATTFKNKSRSTKPSNVQKSQTKNSVSRQPQSKKINASNNIKIQFGNNSTQNSMYKPSSILKKTTLQQPSFKRLDGNLFNLTEPTDLELFPSRRFYSPIHTPPRLRTLITPPGIEPYRNSHNLRRLHSPLPTVGNYSSVPTGLDTWGINLADYDLVSNINLVRRYPSPLTHIGLGSGLARQKKPYIVVPRLDDFLTLPVSNVPDTLSLSTRRVAPAYIPDSHYSYLDNNYRISSPLFVREPSDYVYIKQNEGFANQFIEDFIGRFIQDQFIPDILLEIIGEIEQEKKKQPGKRYTTNYDQHYADLNRKIAEGQSTATHLFSDDWIHNNDHQREQFPQSNIDSNSHSLKPIDFNQLPPERTSTQRHYRDFTSDKRRPPLVDTNQQITGFEPVNIRTVPIGESLSKKKHPTDNVQHKEIDKYAENRLLDSVYLDQLIGTYVNQNSSIVDVDDLARLLDATVFDNLTQQYQNITEARSRTVDNYGAKKFHLNSFMNVTMDLLLTELSGSLIEDMKDLDEQERRTF